MRARCQRLGILWGLALGSCVPPNQDAQVSTFLNVGFSAHQPQGTALGTAVFVQAQGGSHLGLATYGGTQLFPDIQEPGVTRSCLKLTSSEPLYVYVRPTGSEAIFYAALFELADNTSSISSWSPCVDADLAIKTASLVVPIVPPMVPAENDASAAGGSGSTGTGGAGGTSNNGAAGEGGSDGG